MAEAPITRATLLARLKNGRDAEAWSEFVQLYGPVVFGFARNRGLQDSDAADLMQEVLRSVARNASKMEYDPKRGTFRGWLYTVTRNKIFNYLSSQRNKAKAVGDSGSVERLEAIADYREDPEADWDKEYQLRLSMKAMERVRPEFQPKTWQAFVQTAVDGLSAEEVGKALKMSAGAVYVAKSRVIARLRDEVKTLEQEAEAW